jgi:peptide/nickel transport system substrate-binding protein
MKKIVFLALAIIMVLSISLAGCGTTETTTTTSAPPATSKTTAPSATTVTVKPPPDNALPGLDPALYKPEGGKTGGRLQFYTSANIANVGDPSGSAGPSDAAISFLAVEPLILFDKLGVMHPWLAESWTIAADKSAITFVLRKGVNFTDGTPFNADAAKYNIDNGINSLMWPNMKKVATCTKLDEYTIKLDFVNGKWDWVAMKSLQGFWSVLMFSPTALKNNTPEWKMTHVIGTGPFIMTKYEPNLKVSFDRNPNYWRGAPYLDGVDYNIITDSNVALMAFKSGKIHYTGIQAQDAQGVIDAGFELTKSTDMVFNFCLLPSSGNPNSVLSNLKVRQAVEHAINKQALVDAFSYGYGEVTNQGFCLEPFKDPTVVGYAYDKAKAKALLAEAGFSAGLTITLYGIEGGSDDVPLALKGMMEEVGITFDYQKIGYLQLVEMIGGGGKGWDGYIVMYAFPGDTVDPASTLANGQLNAIRGADGKWMVTTWISCEQPTELCDLAEQGSGEVDATKRIPIYQKISRLASDKYCQWSFMYYTPGLTSISPKVKGHTVGMYKEFLAWTFAYLTD